MSNAELSTDSGRHPNYGALANLDVEGALREMANGTFSKTIAERYGVSPRSLRDKLSEHPDYKATIRAQAESIVESATLDAIECGDKDEAPIVRVRVDAAHKWASKRDPERWGEKQIVQQAGIAAFVMLTGDDLIRAVTAAQQSAATHQVIDSTAVRQDEPEKP